MEFPELLSLVPADELIKAYLKAITIILCVIISKRQIIE